MRAEREMIKKVTKGCPNGTFTLQPLLQSIQFPFMCGNKHTVKSILTHATLLLLLIRIKELVEILKILGISTIIRSYNSIATFLIEDSVTAEKEGNRSKMRGRRRKWINQKSTQNNDRKTERKVKAEVREKWTETEGTQRKSSCSCRYGNSNGEIRGKSLVSWAEMEESS